MKAISVTLVSCILCFALLVSASGVIAKSSQSSRENDPSTELMEAQNLTEEGQIGGSSSGVAIQGQFAYIGVGHRMVILNIVDPSHPFVVGKTEPLAGVVFDVEVSGNYAYIAAFINGLRIIDISSPANPFEVGYFMTGGNPQSLEVIGDYAYLLIFLLDFESLTSPTHYRHSRLVTLLPLPFQDMWRWQEAMHT
jgi:hypothetical protein